MSDILSQLGIDEDEFDWYHLAACANIVKSVATDIVFDKYESDTVTALQTDQMCLHCPVAKRCYQEGVKTKSDGVWGGVYLSLGKVSKKFNAHKTPEVWKAIRRLHGKIH